ncbi:uncharacterized protein [Haliotis asinina]|uniref:uncharacterized protein n=1 Tax=Haliotis asinina TaxID=109174 RepID=UPI0035327C8C
MKMWKLRNQIATEKENVFTLATNDFFRPDLKQIGNSIFEIKKYFLAEGGRTITPSKFEDSLSEVKDCLSGLVENHAFFLDQHPKDDKGTDKNYPKTEPCFMFLSETLSFALDFATSPRPNIATCDVFIAFPTMPTMVLSIVDADEDSEEALAYNTSVARGVRDKLVRFMDEDVNSIHGVISISTLKNNVAFNTRLKVLATDSFRFVPEHSLLMNIRRYDRVLTAFWAGVAETKSVLKEVTGDTDVNYLRFLTKEQCIILVENINSKDVEVKCMPGSGGTTLMLEVARRLNRLGNTLLVSTSRQERNRLRSVCPSAVSSNDLSSLDLSPFVNIVDETNSVPPETRYHRWKFTRYLTDMKQLEYKTWMLEKEIDRMEKFLDVFTKDMWRRRMKYLLGDIDVLILLSEKIKRNVIVHQAENSPQMKPHLPPTGSFSFENVDTTEQETQLSLWQERVEQERSVFPLLRSVMMKDRTSLIYQDVKMAFLKKVSGSRGEEKRQESSQRCWKQQTTVGASPDDMSIEAKDGGEQQITDVVDEQDTYGVGDQNIDGMQDIESLNEELDSLMLNRDDRRRQLDRLQTDCWTLGKFEWQNSVDYLMRYPEVLSLFNVELPGMDSVISSHREYKDESNLPRGIKHRPRTVFTKDTKQKLSDVTSKLVEVNREDGYTAEGGCHGSSRCTGLIHQLRRYQHGSLKESDLTALTLKVMRERAATR